MACGGKDLPRYINLGDQVPANTYIKEYTTEPLRKYPLEVLFCRDCSHSQLSKIVDPKELYRHYLYVSGTTQKLQKHFQDLVSWALCTTPKLASRINNISVLDIGANDYSLLKAFRARGCKVEGVDPADNLSVNNDGISALVDFWSTKVVSRGLRNAPYDLITGLNVFAHNPDPLDFLNACRRVLAPEGRVIIEYPYAKSTIQTADFGQIYGEHISYYTVNSMAKVCERAFFYIDDIIELPEIHGGSLRFVLKVGLGAHCQKARDMILAEYISGMQDYQIYLDFNDRVIENIADLVQLIRRQPIGRPVIAYGASAKLSTLLGFLSWKNIIPTGLFNFIVDDNPLKIGHYQTDSEVLIKEPGALLGLENPLIIVTAHNFFDEIKKRLLTMGVKGEICKYVPVVEVEEI